MNYDEFRYTMGGFAAVDARVIMKAFDEDSNNMVEGDELTKWKTFVQEQLSENDWNPSEDTIAAMKQAWQDAQGDFLVFFRSR